MHRWVQAIVVFVLLAFVPVACGDTEEITGSGQEENKEETEQVARHDYATRPDLEPPVFDVTATESSTPGYIFLAPRRGGAQPGPLIIDDQGEMVWAAPTKGDDVATDFRVQTYQGEPVLTWWEGKSHEGWGEGEFIVMDTSYEEVARVEAGGGLIADFHEFRLTDDGTALLIAYKRESADLTAVEGPKDGYTLESYVQEVDIATGEVLFEWRAADHASIDETLIHVNEEQNEGTKEQPFDWFHANSVAVGPDNTLLISARNTHAVYAIDRGSGELRWQLGGKESDFEMGDGTEFAWQHDAQWLGDGRMSLYDNQGSMVDPKESRALILDVDLGARKAMLSVEALHPDQIEAPTQGNTQAFSGGGLFVGWGHVGRATEFDADGQIVSEVGFEPATSYRAYRYEWNGRPSAPPDVVAMVADDGIDVAVSWNGATEVAEWRVLGGDDENSLEPSGVVPTEGFETTAHVDPAKVVAVEALDASGNVLATSAPVTVGG